MKKIEKTKNYWALIGIGVFILYFLYNQLNTLPLALLGIDYTSLNLTVKVIYLLLYEFAFVVILFLIFKNIFIKDFKEYINNFKPLMKKYIEYWALAFGLMIISNLIIVTLLPDSTANNQEILNDIFSKAPFYMIISSVIFAPFIEEIVFRLGFRKIFQNDILFIITSGLVFGSLHVVGSLSSWTDLIYIIPYSIPGFVFAYTLVKSKNIFIPISLHLFHNGFTMLMQIILALITRL